MNFINPTCCNMMRVNGTVYLVDATAGRERRLSASSASRQAPLSRLVGQTKGEN